MEDSRLAEIKAFNAKMLSPVFVGMALKSDYDLRDLLVAYDAQAEVLAGAWGNMESATQTSDALLKRLLAIRGLLSEYMHRDCDEPHLHEMLSKIEAILNPQRNES